jgi:ABC-type transport system involved in cytochrome c biogenesis permease subunit
VGIPVSLILIAVGAILTFAVNQDSSSAVDVDAVGWILMAVGFVSVLLSLIFWSTWAGPGYWSGRRRATYVDEGPPPASY